MELPEEYINSEGFIEIAESWDQRILRLLRELEVVICVLIISFTGFDYLISIIPNNTQLNI